MKYLRVFSDETGASHIEECAFEVTPVRLVDDAPMANITGSIPVTSVQMFHIPAGTWEVRPHPTPRRELRFVLSGALEIEASDGTKRTLTPGDIFLAEDTNGAGHITRSVDGQHLTAAWMPLATDANERSH